MPDDAVVPVPDPETNPELPCTVYIVEVLQGSKWVPAQRVGSGYGFSDTEFTGFIDRKSAIAFSESFPVHLLTRIARRVARGVHKNVRAAKPDQPATEAPLPTPEGSPVVSGGPGDNGVKQPE